MKRTFILLYCFSFLQIEASTTKNSIKANVISPYFGTGSFFYERMISEQNSLQIGLFYHNAASPDRIKGFGITPEFRYYPFTKVHFQGLHHIYFGSFLRYQNLSIIDEHSAAQAKLTTFGGGIMGGYHMTLWNNLSLDIFFGSCNTFGKLDIEDQELNAGFTFDYFMGLENDFFDVRESSDNLTGSGLRLGLTIGLSF